MIRTRTGVQLLALSITGAFGQKAAFVIGEKVAGSVGFYDSDGRRLTGVKLGSHPHEMVLSPDRRTLYVCDNGVLWMTETGSGENTVSIVDIESRTKTGVIDLGEYRRPHGITLDGRTGRLFVSTENPSCLLSVDPVSRKIVRKYDVQGKAPHIVQLGTGSVWAYVSNTDTGTLAAVNVASGEVKLTNIGERPQGMAFSRDRRMLYVANSGGTSIAAFDTAKNERIGQTATGKAPVRLVVAPDGKTLVYALQEGRSVGFADLTTGKEVAQIPLGGRPVSLTLSLDGRLAYSSLQEEDRICVISLADRKIVRTFETPKGTGPDPVFPLE
jgi:DNA-binding beta-propeller fold protein YncE